eukprot:142774_1
MPPLTGSALDDYGTPYAQTQHNRVSNPPSVILEDGMDQLNMMRHYSDPLPGPAMQPAANNQQTVKASPPWVANHNANTKPIIDQDQLSNNSALDDFVNPYAQAQRNHQGPPPAILEESDVNHNMVRPYADPFPSVQPAADQPQVALPNMRPPCLDVAVNNNNNLSDNETWKCSVCTYENHLAVNDCLICGLDPNGAHSGDDGAAMECNYVDDFIPQDVDDFGGSAMYATDNFIPQDVDDFAGGSAMDGLIIPQDVGGITGIPPLPQAFLDTLKEPNKSESNNLENMEDIGQQDLNLDIEKQDFIFFHNYLD